jgi:hypothetical protein
MSDNPFTKDQIIGAYNRAPDPVRKIFNADTTTQIVLGLQGSFQLHVDQTGVLAKEIGYLLLGLENPDVFMQHLRAAGFDENTVQGIVREVNEKIFIPLRKEMEQVPSGAREAQPSAPVVPRPKAAVPPPPRVSIPAPAPMSGPTPPPMPMRAPIMDPERELPAGEETFSAKAPSALPPTAPLPPKALQPKSAGAPNRAVPPTPRPLPPRPPTNLPGAIPPPPPVQSYSSDPYREPVE